MLDKSIPYIDIVMQRAPGQPLPKCELVSGYRYVLYKPGDINAWADIETSVGEFETIKDACKNFKKEFLPVENETEKRMLFIETKSGEKIATATAWWRIIGGKRYPLLHWIAVKPNHQGKRLGKAITARVVQLMHELEGDLPMYLHTQTWSHKAVRIYEWAGFIIAKEPNILNCPNDKYDEAIKILNELK